MPERAHVEYLLTASVVDDVRWAAEAMVVVSNVAHTEIVQLSGPSLRGVKREARSRAWRIEFGSGRFTAAGRWRNRRTGSRWRGR